MLSLDHPYVSWAVALGIGLLIGVDRERRKGEGVGRAAAGLRTFAITSLLGAASMEIGGPVLLSVTTAGVFTLTALAYFRTHSEDPGLTTEIALVLTLILGGLAVREPLEAAALAVAAGHTPSSAHAGQSLDEIPAFFSTLISASIMPLSLRRWNLKR